METNIVLMIGVIMDLQNLQSLIAQNDFGVIIFIVFIFIILRSKIDIKISFNSKKAESNLDGKDC